MIFICSHTPNPLYKPSEPYEIVTPGQHNLADNIFNKIGYRHLRGMYYIWKHPDLFEYPDLITIFQYRRYLRESNLPDNFSIVVPEPIIFRSTLWQWNTCSGDGIHRPEYMQAAVSVLGKDFEEYINLSNSPCGFFHNIYSMNNDLYCEHCDFLFNTLQKVEDKILVPSDKDIPVYAFLAERLANYWIWSNVESAKIKTTKLIELRK